MELIEQLEYRRRGLYAGSIGYLAPGGDFDFNVVIRAIFHDAQAGLLSWHVGGAITWDSDPAEEYAETLTKALAIRKTLKIK
jgi:para-aminobenzoate synthetase component 1